MAIVDHSPSVKRHSNAVTTYSGSIAVAFITAVIFPIVSYTDGYPIGPDAAVYLFSGHLTARTSGITYQTLFDVKPPGIHLISTGLHVAGFGRETTYLLSVGLMWVVFVGIAVMIAYLVNEWTQSQLAAIVAPLALLVEEASATAWMHGPMGKYFVGFFFLMAVVALHSDRPYLAVALGTLPAAFWQFAIIIPFIMLLAVIGREKRPRQLRVALVSLGIMGVLALAISLPYLITGAFDQLIAQVGVVSFVASKKVYGASLYGWLSFIENYKLALPVYAVGVGGLGALAAKGKASGDLGKIACAAWAAWVLIVSLPTGQAGPLDTIVIAPFISLGVGIVIGLIPDLPLSDLDHSLPPVSLRVSVVILLGVFSVLAAIRTLGYPPYHEAGSALGMQYLSGMTADGCHTANNRIGQWWVRTVGESGEVCRSLRTVLRTI